MERCHGNFVISIKLHNVKFGEGGIIAPLFDDSSYLLIRSNKTMYFLRFKVATDKEKIFPQMLQWFQWC